MLHAHCHAQRAKSERVSGRVEGGIKTNDVTFGGEESRDGEGKDGRAGLLSLVSRHECEKQR